MSYLMHQLHRRTGDADIGEGQGRSCLCLKNQYPYSTTIFVYFSFIYTYVQYYLFALYIHDLIVQLKHSGHVIHARPPRANAGPVTVSSSMPVPVGSDGT